MASIKIIATITPAWQRANAKAIANAKRGLVAERVGCGQYIVPSAHKDAKVYAVHVISCERLQATCICPTGDGPCWHKSAALTAAMRRIHECRLAREAQPVVETPAPTKPAMTIARTKELMARFGR